MLKKIMACMICLPICSLSFAADWKLFTFTSEYFVSIDNNSLKRDSTKDTLDFWYKSTARKYIPNEKVFKGDYGLFYTTLNCAEKTLATKSYVTYSTTGSVKESETVSDPVFEPIVPETIGEQFLELCTSTPNSTTDINQKSKKIDI